MSDTDTEIEFKFRLSPAQAAAVEAAVRRGTVERTRLQARYFDTADNALARHRMAWRLRKEGRRWVQTLKAAGHDSLQRLEHNVDLGTVRSSADWLPDPALHAGTAVGDLLQQALAGSDQPLALTYETDVWRLARLLRVPGGGWAELAFDQGHIRARTAAGKRISTPVLELELELVRGELPGFTALAQRWAERHGLWLSTVSKAEQGERLRAGITAVPPAKAGGTRFLTDRPTGREILQRAVASCLEQILPNASEVAAGSEDAEQIHQLRIGLRRLRTALRELGPLAPEAVGPDWMAPLVDVFRALGAWRDRQEVLETAQAHLLAAGGPELSLPATAVQQTAGEAVRAAAFQQVLVALMGFVAQPARPSARAVRDAVAPADPNGLDHAAAMQWLRTRVAELHAGMERAGKRYRRLTPAQRHTVRKRLKRLRYLIEFTAALFGRKSAARYLAKLRPAQDALGEYNDAVVALQTWREWVAHDPRAWFGVGWFLASEPAQVAHCERQLRRLREAPRFWLE